MEVTTLSLRRAALQCPRALGELNHEAWGMNQLMLLHNYCKIVHHPVFFYFSSMGDRFI